MIERERWEAFAKMLHEKYYDKDLGMVVVPHGQFDREVAEFTGGFSSYRVREWKKAGLLFGFLYKLDDLRFAIVLPGEEKKKKVKKSRPA